MATLPLNDLPTLMDRLPAALRRRLWDAGVPVRYRDGGLIHRRGDAKPGLSIVREEAVRMDNVGRDGSILATVVLGPGECFGEFTLFAGLPRTHDATAMGDTLVVQIDRARFDRLADDAPALLRHLLEATALRLHRALEQLDDLQRLSLPARAAKLLLQAAGGSGAGLTVAVRQSDVAETLGVSRVAAGQALATLAGKDLISRGYGRITIPDPARLRQWLDDQTLVQPVVSSLIPPR